MDNLIVVHADFDRVWPFAADHFHALWQQQGKVDLLRLATADQRCLGETVDAASGSRRLACLGMRVTPACLRGFNALEEATFQGPYSGNLSSACVDELRRAGVRTYEHPSEGFWGESVAEYGLALTLCGLRRIPQLHRAIIADRESWDYEPPDQQGRPGARGHQFGDDPDFASGTAANKKL